MSGYPPASNNDPEAGFLGRKRSLVRPERQRLDPSHPRYHYAQVASQESGHLKIQPAESGLDPQIALDNNPHFRSSLLGPSPNEEEEGIPLMNMESPQRKDGVEVFGLNDESPKRAANARSRRLASKKGSNDTGSQIYPWKVFCYMVTFWAPAPLLRLFGLKSKLRQFAWREKMGLIAVICCIGAIIAYITFGFTRTVCKNSKRRVRNGDINSAYLIINGNAYDLSSSRHPAAAGIPAGLNVLYPPVNAGGQDASFMFQNVNGHCKDLIVPRDNCLIPHNDNELAWYMPCRTFLQYGSDVNDSSVYYDGWACHTSPTARDAYFSLKVDAEVYFTWDDIRNSTRNLVVYSGVVLDLDLINWISAKDVTFPDLFTNLRDDPTFKGHDISMTLSDSTDRQAARCLTEIIRVGTIDSDTVGCIASKVVLITSLIFILSVVLAKFLMACYFRWAVSPRQGASLIDNKSMAARDREIDNWVDNPSAQPPIHDVPVKSRADYRKNKTNRQSVFLQSSNQLNALAAEAPHYQGNSESSNQFKYTTMNTQAAQLKSDRGADIARSVAYNRRSSQDLLARPVSQYNPFDAADDQIDRGLSVDLIHPDVIPQPPVEYMPFGYPLVHTIISITCYSENEEGLRTSLDSVATTDYPNSHKLIVVVCDGLVKGAGNEKTTPEIVLGLMTDLTIPQDEVKAHSYVAVALGRKRHNMAKVYGGFYKYDDEKIPVEKQQRVPMVVIVKCGAPDEAGTTKPGNRGKRDSQIILMSFFQRIMFDERMTALEYTILETIWRVTGLRADFYETILMVDADTMVYNDCLTHMVAEMVKDPEIMGLCGETKIANKNSSWVTLIQVFEYYISHHQAKGFESLFGGVTCLPGCFSMYRIKTPKGSNGFWVPILANPDIVERYSDNVVDTLHKKNLLLLGEDRFLTTLMLRTFPKRKNIFVPKAACKTLVPDSFKVLLSQRRRWINSTVHNLFELVLVKDLCGTFCFSMQFVVFIELVGTMVLPAAITITVYVIVFAIVSKPTPVLSLILLGVIFGLPGAIIVVTVSSLKYILYFFIYLLALPIWNFVLPVYAYWKFDDFSWGDTRAVAGDKGDHSALEGEFDSSCISMKRWREWERDQTNRGIAAPGAVWDPANAGEETEYSDNSYTLP